MRRFLREVGENARRMLIENDERTSNGFVDNAIIILLGLRKLVDIIRTGDRR